MYRHDYKTTDDTAAYGLEGHYDDEEVALTASGLRYYVAPLKKGNVLLLETDVLDLAKGVSGQNANIKVSFIFYLFFTKSVSHAQIDLLKELNLKFPTSILVCFIWESTRPWQFF